MMAQGLRTAFAGASIGGALALGLSVMLRAQMYGLPPVDIIALVAVSAVLLGVVLLASLIPARTAARVDPIVVLREE